MSADLGELQAAIKVPLLENQIRKLLIRNIELLQENARLKEQLEKQG